MLLVFTILFLMGEIFSLKKLLNPISVIKQIRKDDMEKLKKNMTEKNDESYKNMYIVLIKIFMTILIVLYSLFFYLANLYINNFIFSIISAALIAHIILDMILYSKRLDDIDFMISKKCSTKAIVIDIFIEIIYLGYGLFVMFTLFFGNTLFK